MRREQEMQRMNAEKAGLEETIQSLRVEVESSSALVSTPTCTSLTQIFIRQQKCGPREDHSATP